MLHASICTIGDEILIGQIIDTNSSCISRTLEETGIKVTRMLSIGDDRDDILTNLRHELEINDIVITTGGLGPTKDDITKSVLAELSGSKGFVTSTEQLEIVHQILHSRGLDVLDINLAQANVPDTAEVIPNRLGTAPVMVFHIGKSTLYSLPGVPHEAIGALPDVIQHIKTHNSLTSISHRSVMVFGLAESALSKKIESWENNLPSDMHLAYLPNPLTGIRLRLSIYGGDAADHERRIGEQLAALHAILGDLIYSFEDDTLEHRIGTLLKASGKTLAVAESCTGGEISHLVTTVPGSSSYYLGSVTSYAISVKEKILGVPSATIREHGVVSAEVAAAMAEGVRRALGSDYSVATTGLAGPGGDDRNPEGTVWIGVSGPRGTVTARYQYKNDRKRNIERFAAAALNMLRKYIEE
ncbi:MAG: CinA family nicotinamide mononucleotide deamidase-related protein [Bacteroidales bacterium]|nr:CinA family nicotinamide mononucleotide deamidase-related protein [Bacteroidales bacterium]